MASINDISIAVNALFQDIKEPMTLGLNKINFFKTHKNTFFRFSAGDEFEFNINPILQFDDAEARMAFLKKEKVISARFQDFTYDDEIQTLIDENDGAVALDNFYLDYTVEIEDDEILILFNTNSLIFKYEVIG